MNYGRNVQMRQSPLPQHRLGRFINGAVQLPNGVPVRVPTGATTDGQKRLPLELATGAQVPKVGVSGILFFEWAFNWERGKDVAQTNPSDLDYVEALAPAQVVYGDEVKLAFVNTTARNFPTHAVGGGKAYTGRIMVPGVTVTTPGVAVGDLLTPGVGNDTSGYWAVTATAANGWLRVTSVNGATGTVEAQMIF